MVDATFAVRAEKLAYHLPMSHRVWKQLAYKSMAPAEAYRHWRTQVMRSGKLRLDWCRAVRGKEEAMRLEEDYSPGAEYCLCRRPFIQGEDMLECLHCKEWYHYQCIGFRGSALEAEQLGAEFRCPRCSPGGSPPGLFGPARVMPNPFRKS